MSKSRRLRPGWDWVSALHSPSLFWVIAGLIPPIHPSDTADQIAAIYSENGLRIRIGLALMALSVFLLSPFLRCWHDKSGESRAIGASCRSARSCAASPFR
jgi:hypothetical protein